MNHDWQDWIDRLKSKDLTAEELREFEAALRDDPTHADAYLDALLTESALEAGGLPPFEMPEIGKMDGQEERTIPFSPPAPTASPAPGRRYWLPVAACFCLLATAGFFLGQHFRVNPAIPQGPVFVATITDTDAAAEAAGLRIGQPLEAGSLKVPENSEIGLAMRDGARLEIRGPSELELDGTDRVRLTRGRVSTYAPTYAHGFTIHTQDGRIVDLGTRFVTASGAGLGTEIHVIEGLVEAYSNDPSSTAQGLKGENAVILKDGRMKETDYLARRLEVPLDPLLPDTDGDGFPDLTEVHFGTNPSDPASWPEVLRVAEPFLGYTPGAVQNVPVLAKGGLRDASWRGGGNFISDGLVYRNNGKGLRTSSGALQTNGNFGVGAVWFPSPAEFPPAGVTYMSFVMRLPEVKREGAFSGMLLYQGDREQLFVGKISPTNSFGARMKVATNQEAFRVPMDNEPHLFVIRIDRTRLVTDVFIDPHLGEPEASQERRVRYQTVPDFDRIMFRSGSGTGEFKTVFDEFRSGLTWESVLPVEP